MRVSYTMKTLFLFTCLILLFKDGESWVWGGSHWFGRTTIYICQNQKLTLHCGHGSVIKIRYANYGRTNYFTCPLGNLHTADCESSGSKKLVKERCNGKRRCTLKATNSIYGNPCKGTTKYLEVTFSCIDNDEKRALKAVKK